MKCLVILIIIYPLIQGTKIVELLGAGASFPGEVYAEWISLYRTTRFRHVHVDMEYKSVGSGNGKTMIKAEKRVIHYAGSDTPLSDSEFVDHPDLIMFPTMAGSVVIAHNIPGIHGLILDLDVLVGIYSGAILKWNDPLIANLNPDILLPNEPIIPIARADKSGTTNVFTSALSARSEQWRSKYGTFSLGYDSEKRQPYYWNKSVVAFYGKTNSGISGLIMSIDFSLGYLSIADASSGKLNVAAMRNSAGNVVNASVDTVQNAMLSANGSISIVNTPGEYAYPIASFTYFIVHKSRDRDCDVAVEFVRYVNWFLNSQKAQDAAKGLFMVPLEKSNAENIVKTYLKTMTCQRNNVWQLLQRQIADEAIVPTNEEWKVPTFISMALFLVVMILVVALLGKQQYKIHKELLKDSWKVPADAIDITRQDSSEFHSNHEEDNMSNGSGTKQTSRSHIVFVQQAWNDDAILMGLYHDQPITLTKLSSQNPILTLKHRRLLLWMRDNIKHNNVMPFVGLTHINSIYYTVHSGYIRGTLTEVLKNPKIMIYKDGIIALMKSLIRGLHHLHKKGVIHGRLTGKCCFIDTSWTLKIGSWEEMKICQNNDNNRVLSLVDGYSVRDPEDEERLLWTAPEIIKFNRAPSHASDVYSFSMVLQEMFTMDTPYSELKKSVSDVVNAILRSGIRPRFASSTPYTFRNLMERCWDNDPDARSTLVDIETSVFSAFPKDKPLIDCIFSSVEQYARSLEDKVKDIQQDLDTAKEAHEVCLYRNVPEHVAHALKTTGNYDTRPISNVCMLACKVACIENVMEKTTRRGITTMMNHLYTGITQLLLQDDIYRVHIHGVECLYIVGLQQKSFIPAQTTETTANIALRLKQFTSKFKSERLQGMEVNLDLQIGIACGDVTIGVMDKSMPHLTVFGDPVQQATYYAMVTEPGFIRISEEVYVQLQKANCFQTSLTTRNNETVYTLDDPL